MKSYSDKQNIELVKRDQLRLSNIAELESTYIDNSPKNTILIKSKNKESITDKICNFILYLIFLIIYYLSTGYIYYCMLFGFGFLTENSDLILNSYTCLNPISICFLIGFLVFNLIMFLLLSIYYYYYGNYSS